MTNNSGLRPLGCSVLVKPDPVEAKTKGGLYLPDAVRTADQLAEQRATVIEVGPLACRGAKDEEHWWPLELWRASSSSSNGAALLIQ